MIKQILLIIMLYNSTLSATPLLIINTSFLPSYTLETLKLLAQQAGFVAEIINLEEITAEKLNDYHALMVPIDAAVCMHINKDVLLKKYWNLIIENIYKKNNVTLFLFLANGQKNYIFQLKDLLADMGLMVHPTKSTIKKYINLFKTLFQGKKFPYKKLIDDFIAEISKPLPHRSEAYDTTLLRKQKETVCSFLPLGFEIQGQQSHILFSSSAWLDWYEINENFWVTPLDHALRDKYLEECLEQLRVMHKLIAKNNRPELSLPRQLTAQFELEQKEKNKKQRSLFLSKTYNFIHDKPLNIAWIELEPYMKNDQTLQKGIHSIIDARLNVLWITCNVERFFSPLVNHEQQQQGFEYMQQLALFIETLKTACKKSSVPMPKILPSFDLTTNFAQHKPVYHVVDAFGTHYPNIPCPLDYEDFWQPELIRPLKKFIYFWRKLLPDTKLDGIFLDLEMYHAQRQTAEYTNTMDFSDFTWQLYEKSDHAARQQQLSTARERFNYLLTTHRYEDYMRFLQQQITVLAKRLFKEITTLIPDALVGVYTMTLPSSWFLTGLLSGLSTPQRPILLCTFNTNFYSHAAWLTQQKIFCLHAAPLLLSKFRDQHDFQKIADLLPFHDGIWFNRFSRLVEEYDEKAWWELEASPLPIDNVSTSIGNYFNEKRRL